MPNYKLGTDDPKYIEDYGSGPWCMLCNKYKDGDIFSMLESMFLGVDAVRKQSEVDHLLFQLREGSWLRTKYPHYPIAASHLRHYFENHKGTDADPLDIKYGDDMMEYFMSIAPKLRANFDAELKEAKSYCEEFSSTHSPDEMYDITSGTVARGDFNGDNDDLFFAIGGYQYWGKGRFSFTEEQGGDKYNFYDSRNHKQYQRARYFYTLNFNFIFFDRYNWNKGQRADFYTPSDDTMGQYHKPGLAREYNIWGSFRLLIEWLES